MEDFEMRRGVTILPVILAMFVIAVSAEAQPNTSIVVCFAPAANISGSVTLEKYPGCIAALSASFNVSSVAAPSGGGGAGTGKTELSPVVFSKYLDAASPVLFLNAVKGVRVPSVDVYFLQPSGDATTELAKLSLSDVAVSAIKQTGADGNLPTEKISLIFGKMCVASGASAACYDSATGTAS